jgi:hypothetical protein
MRLGDAPLRLTVRTHDLVRLGVFTQQGSHHLSRRLLPSPVIFESGVLRAIIQITGTWICNRIFMYVE